MINSKIQNLMVRRANEDESGFTLIELLIVMIIIGVLAAIAIPAFLNQQKGARDTQTTSDVRNAAIAAQTLLTQYPDAHAFTLTGTGQSRQLNAVSAAPVTTLASEDVKLSAGTELAVGSGEITDGFTITGWNVKGKRYIASGSARLYDSANGGLQNN